MLNVRYTSKCVSIKSPRTEALCLPKTRKYECVSTLALVLTIAITVTAAIACMQGITDAYIQNRGCV